jgi:hypothetical protein
MQCCEYNTRHLDETIDIEIKTRLFKACDVPATSATFLAFFLFFLLRPLTVLMKQTRQAVHAVKHSLLLRCLWMKQSEVERVQIIEMKGITRCKLTIISESAVCKKFLGQIVSYFEPTRPV